MKTASLISSYRFLFTYNTRYRHFVNSFLRFIYQYVQLLKIIKITLNQLKYIKFAKKIRDTQELVSSSV